MGGMIHSRVDGGGFIVVSRYRNILECIFYLFMDCFHLLLEWLLLLLRTFSPHPRCSPCGPTGMVPSRRARRCSGGAGSRRERAHREGVRRKRLHPPPACCLPLQCGGSCCSGATTTTEVLTPLLRFSQARREDHCYCEGERVFFLFL